MAAGEPELGEGGKNAMGGTKRSDEVSRNLRDAAFARVEIGGDFHDGESCFHGTDLHFDVPAESAVLKIQAIERVDPQEASGTHVAEAYAPTQEGCAAEDGAADALGNAEVAG